MLNRLYRRAAMAATTNMMQKSYTCTPTLSWLGLAGAALPRLGLGTAAGGAGEGAVGAADAALSGGEAALAATAGARFEAAEAEAAGRGQCGDSDTGKVATAGVELIGCSSTTVLVGEPPPPDFASSPFI